MPKPLQIAAQRRDGFLEQLDLVGEETWCREGALFVFIDIEKKGWIKNIGREGDVRVWHSGKERWKKKPRGYRKRNKGVLRVPSRKAKLSKVVADFIHRARGNIVRAHPVNPSMETGRDIADRFNMQKWFLDASITELDNLDRTINALHEFSE